MKALIPFLLISFLCIGCSKENPSGNPAPDAAQAALRVSNATSRIQEQDYLAALSDMEAAAALAPQNMEYRFLYCLLKERTGEPRAEAKACYAEVAERLLNNPGLPCEKNMNCVIAELMAESELAEKRKHQFLSLPTSEPESEMRRHVLEGFDRTTYLKAILP